MKNYKGWYINRKEYYTAEDVPRYYEEVAKMGGLEIATVFPPEEFFAEDVLEEGLEIMKTIEMGRLKSELHYLQTVKIPEIKIKIENYENRSKRMQEDT